MKTSLPSKLKHQYFIFVLALLLTQTAAAKLNNPALCDEDTRPFASQATAQEPKPTDVGELKPGPFIERELAGGKSHSFRVLLAAKQYLKVLVNQKGIDVVLSVFGPDGQKLTEVDNTGGSERVFVIAESAGEYRVEVRPSDKEARPGLYEIGITELREATEKDRVLVAAQKLLEDGDQLFNERTAESRRKAIAKYDEALPLWRNAADSTGEAQTLNGLGVAYSNLGDPRKAVEYYSQSLPLWRSVGDQINEATALTNMGTAYGRLGESAKALESHTRALPLARAGGDSQIEGLILSNTGSVYWSMGQSRESLKYYTQALAISQARGDRRQQAITLNNIAASHQQLGDLQQALDIFTQSLALRRAIDDRLGEASILNNLGLLYTQLGDLPKALEYYNQALQIRRTTGDRQAQATNLQGMSIIYFRMGDLGAALKSAEEALTLTRAVADPRLEAYVLDVLGRIHQRSREPEKALESFAQSLALRRKVSDRYGEIYSLSNLGNTHLELGTPGKALEYYRESLSISRDLEDKLGSAATLYGMASADRKLGNKAAALSEIEEALKIVEATRSGVLSQDFRSSFLASYQDYFQFFIDLLMEMHQDQPGAGNDLKAFAAGERGRARGLLELLAEAKIDVRQGIAPALKQSENDLQARISWVQSQLIQAHARPKPDQTRIASLEDDFKKIESDRAQLAIEIRQKHPRYADLQYPTPVTVQKVQQAMDEKTVLLEYSLGKNASFLFAISRNDFLAARLPGAPVLGGQVSALREAVASRPDRMTLSNYLLKGRSLYEDLIKPANRLLKGKQQLIIVPDGILHYLPFEVLLTSDRGRRTQLDFHQLPYLVRDFSISYAPSATVLVNLSSPNPGYSHDVLDFTLHLY